MVGSTGSDLNTAPELVDAQADRLVGELATVKGENVQLRQRIAELEAASPAAFRELEASHELARELLEEMDESLMEILNLSRLERGDEGSASYRLGKVHAICERTSTREQLDAFEGKA